jgi:hypothetical protein
MVLGHELGLLFPDFKMVWPCTELKFLGLTFNFTQMEARLPADKLAFLRELFQDWLK